MEFDFVKYHGTGNDFVMIDGRNNPVKFSVDQIEQICHRRFGIGADGIIILLEHSECDFEMDYFNADGSKSFCGNGSRCAQAFAKELNIIDSNSSFLAIDGMHQGRIDDKGYFGTLMKDVNEVQEIGEDYFIHTGSPHYIRYVEDVEAIDVESEGRAIRNSEPYKAEGTNVNFVSIHGGTIKVRTYERGVEGETYSCGTGVTAVAISYLYRNNSDQNEVKINVKGGEIVIRLNRKASNNFQNIWLLGPAQKVFSGTWKINS